MPAIPAGTVTTLQTFPQWSRLGMVIHRPVSIVTGEVALPTSRGNRTLNLNNLSTDRTPRRHYSVIAGSSAGLDDGGKTRMKTLVSNTLTVTSNNIDWANYPYVSILEVVEPWAILPNLKNDKEDYDVSYTDGNLNQHPLARIGPPAVGWTDQAVNFWSNSTAVASGASISSHAWTFPSGSPASSASAGSAGSPIEVTWSSATGHTPHYVYYTVTDSNSKTHTRYCPTWIFDDFDDVYCDWELESLAGDFEQGGWTASVRVYGDATTSEFPVDAMVVMFAEDHYGGTQTSIGGNWTHRENIVFVGWIARDSVLIDDEKGDVTFEIVGPAEKMRQMNCWPANLTYVSGTPSKWHEIKNMTADLAAFHCLTEHTTMDHICDVTLSGDTKTIKYIDIPEENPYRQVDDYCGKPIRSRLLADRQGRLYFEYNINLRQTGNRSGYATVVSLDINDDIRADPGLGLAVEEHENEVAQVDFIGFSYSGADVRPWYSLAPEYQHKTGRVRKVDGIRVDSQSESNILSGLFLANLNNIWREVSLPMFNWRVFDIAPQEYTKLTLAAGDSRRGVTWTAQEFIPRGVSIEYDAEQGAMLVTPTMEKDSFGPPGVTGHYPKSVPEVYSAPEPQWTERDADDIIAFDAVRGCLFFQETSWQTRNDGLTGTSIQDQYGDSDVWWSTREKQNTSDPEQSILIKCNVGEVFRSEDGGKSWDDVTPVDDPPNDWSASPAPTVGDLTFIQHLDNLHKNKHHYVLAIWQDSSDNWNSWLLKTENDCLSWTYRALDDFTDADDECKAIWMDVDSEDGSTLYVTAWTNNAGTTALYVHKLETTGSMTLLGNSSMGSCTEEEMDNKDYIAYPVVGTYNKDYCFVYGRLQDPQSLGDPTHVAFTTDGMSSWDTKTADFGSDHVGAMKVFGDAPNRTLYAIRNSSINYPTLYSGLNKLEYVSDTTLGYATTVTPVLFDVKTDEGKIVVGSGGG